MFIMLYCVIYISEFKCLCYWLSWEKLVKSSHELDAQFTFIAFNKHEPLWLKLWSCGLDNCFGWELAHMCCHMASFQHCTYLYLVDVCTFVYGCLSWWNECGNLVSLMSKYKWLERLTGRLTQAMHHSWWKFTYISRWTFSETLHNKKL